MHTSARLKPGVSVFAPRFAYLLFCSTVDACQKSGHRRYFGPSFGLTKRKRVSGCLRTQCLIKNRLTRRTTQQSPNLWPASLAASKALNVCRVRGFFICRRPAPGGPPTKKFDRILAWNRSQAEYFTDRTLPTRSRRIPEPPEHARNVPSGRARRMALATGAAPHNRRRLPLSLRCSR